jgi:CRISPR-associated protein Csb1
MTTTDDLLDRITSAAAGASDDAGIRITASYEPAAGRDSIVFPPTYPDIDRTLPNLKYALSERHIDGDVHQVVLLDSFQSQANRVEAELQDLIDDGQVRIPYIETSTVVAGRTIRVTNLVAPHRGPDAYFRDSEDAEGTAFDDTVVGQALRAADIRSARPYYEYVPTDLVFGFWDSHRGGRGVKLARAYVSEIVGVDPKVGKRGAVRFDPNNIPKTSIAFPKKHPEDFVVLEVDDEGKESKPPKGFVSGSPSEAGHGNVVDSDANPGVSVSGIRRSAFVSITALRRLRFPDKSDRSSREVDAAGRAVLASIALLGDLVAFDGPSVFLRSGCDLLCCETALKWVGRGGERDVLQVSLESAIELFNSAVRRAADVGLEWADDPLRLRPKENLAKLLEVAVSTAPSEGE